MAQLDIILPTDRSAELPVVRKIGLAELRHAIATGIDDFWAMPTHVVFLSLIYPVVGLLFGRAIFGAELVPLLYPIATGFALLGPFAAIGLYELSRRREQGLDTSWKHAFDIVHSPSLGPILLLGCLLVVLFIVWVAVAHSIYIANFGFQEPVSLIAFAGKVLGTPEGAKLIFVGNLVGFLFAVAAFVLSVISFPLLLDRNVGLGVAIGTSVKVVLTNPVAMIYWAMIIVAGLVIGMIPLFFGLAITMPVLGHASWHLYRAVIEPDRRSRPAYNPPDKGIRYGADFPASLFTSTRDDKREG
jgi:uncharacterized membrane protein